LEAIISVERINLLYLYFQTSLYIYRWGYRGGLHRRMRTSLDRICESNTWICLRGPASAKGFDTVLGNHLGSISMKLAIVILRFWKRNKREIKTYLQSLHWA
jgi:hypothetical protein